MKRLHVNLPHDPYDICIEKGLLRQTGALARNVLKGRRVVVVTDELVADLYAKTVLNSLSNSGFDVSLTVIPPGETSKTVSMLENLYDAFMDAHLTRSDAVLALGGGVVGDLAGFAAATILRGVDYIQVPTTLLAQVDSSVGGKVAVDLKAGKNLAGAFYQPRLVLIDPDCLLSLSARIFADGMAEVIKYGAVFDRDFLKQLQGYRDRNALYHDLDDMIYHCCDFKRKVVLEDEKDHGRRMLLNFGHTLGHAYEAAYDYKTYTHGQAVAAGMCQIARMQTMSGQLPLVEAEKIMSLVSHYGLPTEIPCSMEAYRDAIMLDKKARDGEITLVLLREVGEAYTKTMTTEAVLEWLEKSLARGDNI